MIHLVTSLLNQKREQSDLFCQQTGKKKTFQQANLFWSRSIQPVTKKLKEQVMLIMAGNK